ncbi:MAG: RNA-binding S4 domain-containing protein [Euzebya sp.]
MTSTSISGDTITLGQFLKLANVIEAGGAAKALLVQEEVQVNGDIEVRRGRKLVRGDVVVVAGESFTVS